jgi:hypothetical protein
VARERRSDPDGLPGGIEIVGMDNGGVHRVVPEEVKEGDAIGEHGFAPGIFGDLACVEGGMEGLEMIEG